MKVTIDEINLYLVIGFEIIRVIGLVVAIDAIYCQIISPRIMDCNSLMGLVLGLLEWYRHRGL